MYYNIQVSCKSCHAVSNFLTLMLILKVALNRIKVSSRESSSTTQIITIRCETLGHAIMSDSFSGA